MPLVDLMGTDCLNTGFLDPSTYYYPAVAEKLSKIEYISTTLLIKLYTTENKLYKMRFHVEIASYRKIEYKSVNLVFGEGFKEYWKSCRVALLLALDAILRPSLSLGKVFLYF